MARSMWKGAISFGLVHIPVELHTAVQNKDLDLTMLDRRDFSPIGFKRYNKGNGKEVVWDDIIKGYEYADNEYVVLSDEDLKRANVKATQTIDIQAFVDAQDVPLTYYEQPYYLAPGRGGDKVYALLRETLRKANKIAIANVVIRTKQHLCALVCIGDTIVLNTLRFPDELRSTEDLELPPKSARASGISDKELQMAMSLVEGMAEEWDPDQYHDTYREDVLALVKRKIKAKQTKTITLPEPEEKETRSDNVIDLVALLKQSLGRKPGAAKTASADDDGDEQDNDDDDDPDPDDGASARPPARSKKAAPAKATARTAAGTATRTAAKAAPRTAAKTSSKSAAAAKTPAKGTAKTTPARRKTA
jgi:DNA end-binding protein Ku